MSEVETTQENQNETTEATTEVQETTTVIANNNTPINTEELDMLHQVISDLNKKLKPLLLALTPKQRKNLLKMGQNRIHFVDKSIDYAKHNPEFTLPSMNTNKMAHQVAVIKKLQLSQRALKQFSRQLDNTLMWLSSDVYSAALSYYQSVKTEARRNQPAAETIFKDLKQHFAANSRLQEADQAIDA